MVEDDSIIKRIENIFNCGLDRVWNHHIASKSVRKDNRIVFTANGSTDSNGNASIPIAEGQIPAGKTFYGYKLIQWADGYDPAVPFISTTCYGFITHGKEKSATNMADFFPNQSVGGTAQSFPLSSEFNSKTAPEFQGPNDIPYLHIFNGPATTNIFVAFYGELLNSNAIALAKPQVNI